MRQETSLQFLFQSWKNHLTMLPEGSQYMLIHPFQLYTLQDTRAGISQPALAAASRMGSSPALDREVLQHMLSNSEKARPQALGNPKCLLDKQLLSLQRLQRLMHSLSMTQRNLVTSGTLSTGFGH